MTDLSNANAFPPETPFETRQFHLTREDSLAWLGRKRPLSGLGSGLALASVIIPAFALAIWDDALIARFPAYAGWTEITIGVAALLTYGLAAWGLIALELWLRLRKARVPSTATIVHLLGDRLVVQENGAARDYPFQNLHDPIGTETHLFIPRIGADEDVIIMPLRAFQDRTDMEVFGHMVHEWINRSDDDPDEDDDGGQAVVPPVTPRSPA